MTIYAKPGTTIHIGRVGEGSATKVVFDVSKWFEDYGEGNVELVIDQNSERYPQLTTTVGNEVIWEVSDSNTAEAGMGKCELVYTKVTLIGFDEVPADWYQDWREYVDQDGNQLTGNIRPAWTGGGFPYYKKHTITAKSPVYDFIVTSSLDYDEGAEPPAPYESWVERVIEDADYLRRSIPKVREAEAWAVGTIDEIPVAADKPQHENSAKHWAEEAEETYKSTQKTYEDTVETKNEVIELHQSTTQLKADVEGLKQDTQGMLQTTTELRNEVNTKLNRVIELEESSTNLRNETEQLKNETDSISQNLREFVEVENRLFDEKVEGAHTNFDEKVEGAHTNFDEKVSAANTSFDEKVSAANSDFNTKVASANTNFDNKVESAQEDLSTQLTQSQQVLETIHNQALNTKAEIEEIAAEANTTKEEIAAEVNDFSSYKDEVVAAKVAAETAQTEAEKAQANAEGAQIKAEAAQAKAEIAETSAKASELSAKTSKETAEAAINTVNTSKEEVLAARDTTLEAKTTAVNAANDAASTKDEVFSARDIALGAQTNAENAQAGAENAMRIAMEYSGNPALSINGKWHIWNAEKGEYEDSGIKSILSIVKSYFSITDMQSDLSNRVEGDLVIIASDVEQEDNSKLFVHTGTEWKYLSDLSGLQGVGIAKIERTSGNGAAGTTDIYTITLTDNRTYNFTVYNGADGEGSGDMLMKDYDASGEILAAGGIISYVEEAMKNGTSAVLKSWTAEDFSL